MKEHESFDESKMILDEENGLHYKADCGHKVKVDKGEVDVKEYGEEIVCSDCFYEKAGKTVEENPVGTPFNPKIPSEQEQ